MDFFVPDRTINRRTLVARQDNSTATPSSTCPPTKDLSCPACPTNEVCEFRVATKKNECPEYYCTTASPSPTPQVSSGSSTNVGGVVGGVVGGIAVIGLITYLVWRFCIKSKRHSISQADWDEKAYSDNPAGPDGMGSANKDFIARRDQRSSTHTVHSVASTVLTRASNIIQIAYIPGVTNRATPTSPTLLVPPVPPIPIAVSQASSPAATEDQHFFMPGDLRPDSTYSALSGYTDRTSYARTSYAPRSSIASTIYGKSAVVVAPAQTGMRAKPAMVSVKSTASGGHGGSGANTPPVPSVDYEKYSSGVGIPRPPSPAGSTFSVGSTFLNNATSASAHTAMAARPQVVRVGSGPKKSSSLASSSTSSAAAADAASSGGATAAPSPLAQSSTVASSPAPVSASSFRDSAAVTIIEESPRPDQGPFADPPPRSPANGNGNPHQSVQSSTNLSAIIEEATRRASHRDSHHRTGSGSGSGSGRTLSGGGRSSDTRERSPFGDEHATRDS